LNDPIYVEAARKLAERAIQVGGKLADQRIAFAFQLSTSRQPDIEEARVMREVYEKTLAEYRANSANSEMLLKVGTAHRDLAMDSVELAALSTVTNLILNLDEVVTKE
jgi:hypothetical protein